LHIPINSGLLLLCSGLEIEYDPEMMDYYRWLLAPGRMDYLLLGQHFYFSDKKDLVNIYFIDKGGSTSCYIEYANSLQQAMETGFFKVVAHPDVIFINDLPWDDNCEKACEIFMQLRIPELFLN